MNEKDKEEFDKHLLQWEELDQWNKSPSEYDAFENGFKSACKYKQKEIDEQKELIDFCEQRLHENLKSLIELENLLYENSKLNKLINELEKEKDYLCKKMENMRTIYNDSEKLQAEPAKLRECVEKYANATYEQLKNDAIGES